jgi:LuxR family maltose regulon positive regulatory protein
MENTPPLIQTKFQRPRLDDDLVIRSRLIEKINRGGNRPLTLISAPAGFGKTTLLSAWLQDQEVNSSWISLDENDDDLRIFLRYFVTAIQRVFPDVCEDILSLLEAPQLPSHDYLATKLVNELVALPEQFVLALDDYHFIQAEAIHQILTKFLHQMPAKFHLKIATRKDPALPLSRLRSRKQMIEIRAEDLRFTNEEAKFYLEGVFGEELDQNAVSSLTKSTEGWVTGLRLAALSMRGQEDLMVSADSLSGSSTFYVREYLFNEVLARQTQDIQDFLLQSSILDKFCSELCDAVIGASTSDILLEKLARPNLFLIEQDMERKWYRYHHLFRDMLLQRMKRTYSQAEIHKLLNRASSWFEKNGMIQEALNHALAAGNLDGAAKLIEDSRHKLLNDEDWFTLERWLNRLPDELVQKRAALLLARAWTLELRYQMSLIPPILQKVETLISAEDEDWTESQVQDARGEIDALKSLVYYTNDEGARALESALAALERIPVAHTFTRSIAIIVMALALHSTGQSTQAIRKLNASLAETNSKTIVARVLIGQIYIHMMQADFYQAEYILNQLQSVMDDASLAVSKVFTHWVLGRINYERNKLNRASKHFSVVYKHRYNAQFIMVYDSMLALAMCAHAHGFLENETKALTDLRNFSHERGILGKLHEINSFEARLSLHSDNEGRAIQLAQSIPSDISPPMLFLLEIPIISKTQILITQGTVSSLQEAKRLLEKLLAYIRTINNTYHEIRILACLALVCQAQGATKDAQIALERSLKLAQPAGFIRSYVDLGPKMAELLRQTADRGFETDYVHQILTAFSGQPQINGIQRPEQAPTNDDLIEPLTRRERQVLVLLGKWLSDKEIAQELVISPRTVKKHTSNIYAKLGVKNRVGAVEKAKDLNLLKS